MKEGCKFCDKKGLPIVPVRYGIAPDKVFSDSTDRVVQGQAPDVAERFVPPESGIELGNHEHYTLRVMRSGYLFVYDEIAGQWTAYAVTDEGYFFRVPLDDANPPEAADFACSRNATDIALASVITIDDPDSAGNIWFGFSEVWWPQAVRKANEDPNTRKKLMRCVDVGAWYNSQKLSTERACPVSAIDWAVADYAMKPVPGALSFVWSPFKFQYKQPEAQTLKQACDGLAEQKGLILALEDPAGIAQELSAYAAARWDAFLEQKDAASAHPDTPWSRKLQLDGDLSALESAVKKNAEHEIYAAANSEAAYIQSRAPTRLERLQMKPDPRDPARAQAKQERIEILQERLAQSKDITLDKATLAKASTTAWNEYQTLLDDAERTTFHNHFQQASQAYDTEYIKPVAEAHAAWMQSSAFKAVLGHHFDPQDINGGLALAAQVYACVAGTGALTPCLSLYEQWLKEQPGSDNPIWRALLLNSDTLAAEIQASATSSLIAWQSLEQTFKGAIAGLKMPGDTTARRIASADVLNPLLMELSTPTAKIIAQHRDATAGKALQATLGMHAGAPVRAVEIVGTRRDVYRAVFKQLLTMQRGKSMSLGGLQAAVDERMAIWAAQGVPLDEQVRHWALMFDEGALDEMAGARIKPGQRASQAVDTTLPPGEITGRPGRLLTVDPDTYLGQSIDLARSPGLIAAGSFVLSIVGLSAAVDKEREALKGVSTRAQATLVSAWAGLVAGSFELTSATIASSFTARIPLAGTLAQRLSGKFLTFAKGAGLAGGVVAMAVVAVVDGWNAVEAVQNGQVGLFILYGVTAAVEGIAALELLGALRALIAGSAVTGRIAVMVLTLIALGLTVLIRSIDDPPTMDWAGDCLWGKRDDETYDDAAEEHADFLKATGLA